jgi:hypothetical protein
MKNTPSSAEIFNLFNNNDPDIVWNKVSDIISRISPLYDFTLIQSVFNDVVRLFRGEYPGYCAVKTLYHDLSHTLDVILCGVRLMHGTHLSGDHLSDNEITLITLAMLMHDVGYAQRQDEESGTGAQYTQTHVPRGIEFMRSYFSEHKLPDSAEDVISGMMSGTEHTTPFLQIKFNDERARMMARIVATADITGQMADRAYLEKLLFLYQEFNEAHFGSFQSMYEMLCQTNRFYEETRKKLDGALGGVYRKLEFHFKDSLGIGNNFYLESIEKNMLYLQQVVAHDEAEYLSMLKRNGIVEKSRLFAQSQLGTTH